MNRSPCTGKTTSSYRAAIYATDVISFDIYPVAETNGQLELVPNAIDNLKIWSQRAVLVRTGNHVEENLITLCARCHQQIHLHDVTSSS